MTAEIEGAAGFWVNLVNTSFPEQTNRLDVSLVPNSFFGMGNGSWIDAQEDFVGFVDGGEDGEGVPFQPLLVPARGVEVIIVADAVSSLMNCTSVMKLKKSRAEWRGLRELVSWRYYCGKI